VGSWTDSAFGSFTDVMVQDADGLRTLMAPTDQVADYVAGTYSFDRVEVCPVTCARDGSAWEVTAGPLSLRFSTGSRTRLGTLLRLVPRPVASRRWFCSVIDPVARRVLPGVRTVGRARDGRRMWYCARDQHRIVAAEATWSRQSLGGLAPMLPPVGFGFGSTPLDPSLVRIVTTISRTGS